MAFLMLLHEKLRLQRKINKLTLRQLKASSRKERMTKSIARVQKMYSSRQTKLQKMAQMYQSQFTTWAQNAAGLGTQGLNPLSFSGAGGNSLFFMNGMADIIKKAGEAVYPEGSKKSGAIFEGASAEALWNGMRDGSIKQNIIQKDGKDQVDSEHPWKVGDLEFTDDQYQYLRSGANYVQQMEQMRRAEVQQMTSQYQNNVSIWLEAAEAQLEAEQDAVLAPLEEQETEWDMESQSCETQLADARARLDGIKQALSEGIKDSAPSFGLG